LFVVTVCYKCYDVYFNSKDVNFEELARCTDDFNGAQCKAVCVEAVSYHYIPLHVIQLGAKQSHLTSLFNMTLLSFTVLKLKTLIEPRCYTSDECIHVGWLVG